MANATQTLLRIGMRELARLTTLPDWLPLPGKAEKRQALRTLRLFLNGQIQARRQASPSTAPTDDLLAMLLVANDDKPDDAASAGLSEAEVFDQCTVMFAAGHDTTAAALQWWMWLMAKHPDAAQRARAEIARVIGQRDPTPQDAPQLNWLVASLKEALRLYPPAPVLITRRTTMPAGFLSQKPSNPSASLPMPHRCRAGLGSPLARAPECA